MPVEPERLIEFFSKIAGQPDKLATRLVTGARRYQEAMGFIPQDPDLAYLLLISAVETLSTLGKYTPPLEHVKNTRKELVALLGKLGLGPEQIDAVLTVVAKPMGWTRDRFVTFVERHVGDDVWSAPDPLYLGLEYPGLAPKREALRDALSNIYNRRSAGSHAGRPYPAYVSLGTSPLMKPDTFRALIAAGESERVPAVIWFERAVQSALVRFVAGLEAS